MDRSLWFAKCFIFVFLFQLWTVDSYKILMAAPSHSKSHLIIASALLKGLAERGHEVTMISSFPQKEKIENYRDIYLEVPKDLQRAMDKVVDPEEKHNLKDLWTMLMGVFEYSNNTFGLPEVQKLMKEESFDLVIGSAFGTGVSSGLAAHFNCPYAFLVPVRPAIQLAYSMGNAMQLSSSPALLSGLTDPMSFLDRVKNIVFFGIETTLFFFWGYVEENYYNSNFPQPKYPEYKSLRQNISLLLTAHHFSQGPVMANVPAIVEVGGLQMDTKLAELPKDLQDYLDGATEGAIFFSFGTNVKLKKQNQEIVKAIFKALGRINLKVIFKYDTDEVIPELPKNIRTASWLPQKEILAHPNVKLFISHGGLGSIMESKYYGVPVLGIPLFGDQAGNVKMAIGEGWALGLDISELTEEKLLDHLNVILNNSSYAEKVKKISEVYRDRPMGPMETAIFWVEYVIRHKGAPHLRSSAVQQNLFQRYSIDVIVFLGAILVAVLVIAKFIIGKVMNLLKNIFGKRRTVKEKKL